MDAISDKSPLGQKKIDSPKEFAGHIGVGLRTVNRYLGTKIPFFRLGGRVLIDRDEAIAALKAATGRKV
jgi:hypothetical protein